MSWTLYDPNRDRKREFDSRSEAEEKKQDLEGLGASGLEIIPPGDDVDGEDVEETSTDGGTETIEPDVVDNTEESNPEPKETGEADVLESTADLQQGGYDLPERSVSDDPLQWVPGEFVDTIDGTQAINRKGFAVLGHFYEIETSSQVQVAPEETDFEFCRVKAVATTKDGREYEAHGSAHVDRGDDSYLLLEMADTRAKKRALADATGVGAVAVAELKNEVQS